MDVNNVIKLIYVKHVMIKIISKKNKIYVYVKMVSISMKMEQNA